MSVRRALQRQLFSSDHGDGQRLFIPVRDPRRPDKRLVAHAGTLSPTRALDVGCGRGTHTMALARAGWQVTSVDMIDHELAVLRGRAADEQLADRVRTMRMDITRAESWSALEDASFDLIVDFGCFTMLGAEGRRTAAAGMSRVAAPGATLLMMQFSKVPVLMAPVCRPVGEDEIGQLFGEWDYREAQQAVPEEMAEYLTGVDPMAKLIIRAVRRGQLLEKYHTLVRRSVPFR